MKRIFSCTIFLAVSFFIAVAGCNYAQKPPKEEGPFLKSNLVELNKLDPTLHLDIRYATTNNFTGRPVYKVACAFLQRPAAEALVRANIALKENGYGLIVYDSYRPWSVTKFFWDIVPEDKKQFVADPKKGSFHNRGCAVDVSLYDLKTGKEVTMSCEFDEFSERANIDYQGGTAESRHLQNLLQTVMEAEGFIVYKTEWWHYTYKDCYKYPILNIPLEEVMKSR